MARTTHQTPAGSSGTEPTSRRTTGHVAGLVITGLVVAFLAFDAISHLLVVDAVKEWNDEHAGPENFPVICGAVLTVVLLIHLVPRTAVLGAVLLTGYLGGAICLNLWLEQPFGHSVMAFAVAALAWVGLWLRDPRVRLLHS
ncbi:DoxX family protein [Nocardioides alcanivorans]|uniref:DoxX family protein n=1 Tax=Nocardioides alcanivorans TaxID=2897352 RepID=UPI001F1CE839|nr:DoxX family protein [Nocardioides alcanivorans]